MYCKSFPAILIFIMLLFSVPHISMGQVGVKAGFNLYNVITKDVNGNEVYNDPKLNPGFHVGISYDIPVADNFYLQPAALFSTKGYRIKRVEEYSSIESYISPYYVEIPVNLVFAPRLGEGRLLLSAGPYIAYGIAGKGRYYSKYLVGDETVSDNDLANLQFIKDFDEQDEDKWTYGKPLDYGIQLSEGYEFNNRMSIQITGQLGLANLKPHAGGERPTNKLKNFGLSISVGYRF